MFERFTRNARLVVTHAVEEAESRGDTRIGTEHLLIGVARSRSLEGLMPDVESLRAELEQMDREALASVGLDPGLIDVVRTVSSEEEAGISHSRAGPRTSSRALCVRRWIWDIGISVSSTSPSP